MRIAIDALGLPPFGGAKASALGWLAALGRYGRENHYLVFLSRPEEVLSPFPNIEQRVIQMHNRFAVRIWAQLRLPRLLAREKVDLLHSMKNLSVFGVPCPTIITINDLSHVILRDLYPWADGLYWQTIQPRILRRATQIIAISENTKRDLARFYGLEANKIVTIYPSCDDRFRQPCEPKELERVRAKHDLPESLLLYVGGLGVHKNVTTLVRAFARIADEIPHGLVLVGGAHHTTSDRGLAQEVAALGLADRVWILGSVPEEDLPPLWITFVSFHNMVVLGMWFVGILALGLLLSWRKRLTTTRPFLWAMVLSTPLPLAACQFGWAAAEVGRQPWIVYKLLRTSDAVSVTVSSGELLASIILLGLVYVLLGSFYLFLLFREIRHGLPVLDDSVILNDSVKEVV